MDRLVGKGHWPSAAYNNGYIMIYCFLNEPSPVSCLFIFKTFVQNKTVLDLSGIKIRIVRVKGSMLTV